MHGLHYSLLLIVIAIFLFNPNLVVGAFYIDQMTHGNVLFPPYIYLLNGASIRTAIVLYFTASQYLEAEEITTVFNPHTRTNTIAFATNASALKPITTSSNLQPALESFFTSNRLEQQYVPRISNISMELAPILNPFEVQQLVQVDIGPFVPLRMNEQIGQMPSFSIPSYLNDGFYFVQLSAYFPDQSVNAYYTNSLCLGDCGGAALASWLANTGRSPQSNNTFGSDGLFSSNDTETILNLTTVK